MPLLRRRSGSNLSRMLAPKLYLSASLEARFFSISRRFPWGTILRPTVAGLKPTFDSASLNVTLSSAVFLSLPTSPDLAVSSLPPRGMSDSLSSVR